MATVPSSLPLSVPLFYGLTVALGLCIGVLTGLFGVGGGFLIVPLLHVLLGVPYGIAVGSSLLFILGTSLFALPGHYKKGNFEPKAVVFLSLGSVTGSLFGDLLQDFLVLQVARGEILVFNRWMHGLFLGLLFLTGLLLLGPGAREKAKATGDEGKAQDPKAIPPAAPLQRLRLPPYVSLDKAGVSRVSVPGLLFLGFFIGSLTGLLGVGGGVLFMPILLLVVGLAPKLAVGTSLGVVFFAALAGAIRKVLAAAPKISYPLTAALLLGSTLGVQLGIRLCQRMEGTRLRRYFTLVIALAMAVILWDLARK